MNDARNWHELLWSGPQPVNAMTLPQLSLAAHRLGPLLAASLACALLLTGCTSGASAPSPPAPTVQVVSVVQQDTPIYSEWVATLDGYVNAQIQPRVAGYVIKQNYKEGSVVGKGEVLFEIDPRPFKAALDQAKAQLAQAEAQLGKASLDVQRDTPLAQARAIAQSQLDTEIQAKLGTQALVLAAKANVEQAAQQVGEIVRILGIAEARNIKRPQHHTVKVAMIFGGIGGQQNLFLSQRCPERFGHRACCLHGGVKIHICNIEANRTRDQRIVVNSGDSIGVSDLRNQSTGVPTIVEIGAHGIGLYVQFIRISENPCEVRLAVRGSSRVPQALLGVGILRVKVEGAVKVSHSFNLMAIAQAGIATLHVLERQLLAEHFACSQIFNILGSKLDGVIEFLQRFGQVFGVLQLHPLGEGRFGLLEDFF